MTDCSCFASALQVSESLHKQEAAIASSSFDQILSITRWASAVAQQYATCTRCNDPNYFNIYVFILQKAASCYSHLAHPAASTSASPGTASSSSGSSSQSWYGGGTTRVRIGNFEVETALDDHTRAVILRTELRTASHAAAMLESVLGPNSAKGRLQARDEATLVYHRGLVAVLREDLDRLARYLYSS